MAATIGSVTLARSWTRQLLAAAAGGMLAPVALLVAMLLLGVGGGFGAISSLKQVLAGPGSGVLTVSPTGSARAQAELAAAAVRAAGMRETAAAGAAGATGSGPGTPSAMEVAHPGQPLPAPVPAPPAATPVVRHAPVPAAPTGSARPPSPQPTVVDELAAAGESLAGKLPAPLGPAAGQALQSVATTVDGILPGHGHRGSPAGGAVKVRPGRVFPARAPLS
jgi:hypothetical protein